MLKGKYYNKNMKKQSKITKFVYFGAICGLVIGFGVLILEKAQLTNLYTKPVNAAQANVRPVNDVQYTPASPTENDTVNEEKSNGSLDQTPTPPAAGSPIGVTLTAAGQDVSGGPVVVKVLLTDVTSGTCDITLKQGDTLKTYSASIINAGTYYTCDGFEIPLNDLATGTWQLTATVTSADRSGTATQSVEVKS